MDEPTQAPENKPRYVWPWYVAAAVVLAVVLAAFAIRKEANRVREQQQNQLPAPGK